MLFSEYPEIGFSVLVSIILADKARMIHRHHEEAVWGTTTINQPGFIHPGLTLYGKFLESLSCCSWCPSLNQTGTMDPMACQEALSMSTRHAGAQLAKSTSNIVSSVLNKHKMKVNSWKNMKKTLNLNYQINKKTRCQLTKHMEITNTGYTLPPDCSEDTPTSHTKTHSPAVEAWVLDHPHTGCFTVFMAHALAWTLGNHIFILYIYLYIYMYIYNAPCSKTKHTYGKWRTNDLPVEKGDFHSCEVYQRVTHTARKSKSNIWSQGEHVQISQYVSQRLANGARTCYASMPCL